MKSFGSSRRKRTELNIISLIDVVFILLVFFMISSSFEKPAIQLSLPSASSGNPTERQTVTVTIDAESHIYLDNTPVDLAELEASVEAALGGAPEMSASIVSDKGIPFGSVIEVLDILKQAGVKHVAIRHERQN